MRWDQLLIAPPGGDQPTEDDRQATPLPIIVPDALRGATARTFDTPEFRGMTFYEVRAKSIINKVPAVSRVPFEWTVNPYRGCGHRCVYCFARRTHTYLDLDAGLDFDSKVVVKINAADLLRRELARPKWSGAPIAMGTNVDCYQRAEGRYRLMPAIIAALRDFANPFSILTKGTLILRDLDLLRSAARKTRVGLAMSIGFLDEGLWRSVEAGTPSPRRRLDAVRRLTDAGFEVNVLMAPILPGLTDSDERIGETVAAIAAAGAVGITPIGLHLRPGAREWFLAWLGEHHPHLLPRYRELYRRGSYLDATYQRDLSERVRGAIRRHGPTPRKATASTADATSTASAASAGITTPLPNHTQPTLF